MMHFENPVSHDNGRLDLQVDGALSSLSETLMLSPVSNLPYLSPALHHSTINVHDGVLQGQAAGMRQYPPWHVHGT